MATQATPGNNHQQVPPANHPPAPAALVDPDGDEEIDSDDEEAQSQQYMENVQMVNDIATAAIKGKDVREILKLNPPEIFDGTAYKLLTFLTQLRAFAAYYPTQFTLPSSRV
ncbi:hypothetical protein MRS44_013056 [Fusarium solani]|uniref:uncharacterized protein n=1 Tax=Fusarium solani TaxID=169388 RepID=UPI0032C3D812|nr:hypothetical protein MRS44_013056 [Fusarium solani]